MDDLEKLKAAGIKPLTEGNVATLASGIARSLKPGAPLPGAEEFMIGRLLVTLLEPREPAAKQHHLAEDALSYAISARLENQPEWMAGFVRRVNLYLESTGDQIRARIDGDGIVLRTEEELRQCRDLAALEASSRGDDGEVF